MNPFNRLRFWSLNYLGLNAYTVTEVPAYNPRLRWSQIRFWTMLLEGDDGGIGEMMDWDTELPPDPKAWLEEHRVKA